MKVCYTAGPVKKLENCFSVSTNAVEIRIWFLTDDILRIRAGFDGDWDEASYSLTMTAWDSRTDELMKDCRKRVQTAAAELTDGDKQAVIQGSRLKVVVEKAPFRIMVYDKDGSLLHADIPDLAYREDSKVNVLSPDGQDEVVDNYRNYIQQVVDGQITAEEAAQKTYDDAAALFTK